MFRKWVSVDYSRFPWLYTSYMFGGVQGIVYCLHYLIWGSYGVWWVPFYVISVLFLIAGNFLLVTGKIRITEVLYQRPKFEKAIDFIVLMSGVIYLVMRLNLSSFGDRQQDVFCFGNILIHGCFFLGRVLTEFVTKEE